MDVSRLLGVGALHATGFPGVFAVGVGRSFAEVNVIARDVRSQLRMRTSMPDARPHSNRSPLQSGQPRNGSISTRFKIGVLQT